MYDDDQIEALRAEVEVAAEAEERRFGGQAAVGQDRNESRKKAVFPCAEAFPLDVFPADYQRLVQELSVAFGVNREIPATALLAITGGLIGRSTTIEAKPGWREHANLWLAVIGPSGCGKSPVVNELLKPVFRKEAEWFEAYRAERKAWEMERRQDKDDLSDPPIRKQAVADDWTIESLAGALSGNQRGLLLCRDELAGMIGDMGRYRKSGGDSDKKRLLSAYDCGPWSVSRKTTGDLFVRNACLSVFGTIQPETLMDAFQRDDLTSGFLGRFLFCWSIPTRPALWRDEGMSQWARELIDGTVETILTGFYLKDDGEPHVIELSAGARKAFVAWHDELASMPFLDLQASDRMSATSKLKGQTLRLALVLHAMEYLAANDDRASHEPIRTETMERAVKLARWFLRQSMRVWDVLTSQRKAATNPLTVRVARAVLELQDKTDKGFLYLASVTKRLNEGKSDSLCVHPKTVTAALAKLGIRTIHKDRGAALLIDERTIDQLGALLK